MDDFTSKHTVSIADLLKVTGDEESKSIIDKECKNETQNEIFFFTFGSKEVYPYEGGWVEVYAKDKKETSEKFSCKYPDRKNGLLNCACVYSKEEFFKNGMGTGGNRGYYCHDIIL